MPDLFWNTCMAAIQAARQNNLTEAARLVELAERHLFHREQVPELLQKRKSYLARLKPHVLRKRAPLDSIVPIVGSPSVESILSILRSEYGTQDISLSSRTTTLLARDSSRVRHQIVGGARPIIIWGGNLKQVVGRDPVSVRASDYESIALASDKLASSKGREVSNHFYVVTPSFNSERFIDKTIRSVVSQKGKFRITYHVQDGGSNDQTLAILSKWQQELSRQQCALVHCEGVSFSFSSKPDGGVYDAINHGFKKLMPPDEAICTWINSDDIVAPGAFCDAMAVMKANGDAHWLIGNVASIDEVGETLFDQSVHYPAEIVRAGLCDHRHWRFIQQEGSFWRSQLWQLAGGGNSSLKLCGDWDLWRRFAELADPVHVQRPLAYFRKHDGQLSGNIDKYYQEMNLIVPQDEQAMMSDLLQFRTYEALKSVSSEGLRIGEYCYKMTPLSRSFLRPVGKFHPTERLVAPLLKNVAKRPIRALTFCALAHGGAGTGSLRRVEALRSIGIDAKLVSLVSSRQEKYVGQITPTLDAIAVSDARKVWQHLMANIKADCDRSPGFRASEFFSTTEAVVDFRQIRSLLDDSDILHFHWMVGMLNYDSLYAAVGSKPIVWTTADMNSFTGGCHYSEGCDGFIRSCEGCPLIGNRQDIPMNAWLQKRSAYSKLNITLVCPSESIAALARRSSLFSGRDIRVIPNAYPVDKYSIVEKAKARSHLGLPPAKKLLLFGADNLANKRKGGDLIKVICDALSRRSDADKFVVVTFGYSKLELSLPHRSLGYLDEKTLSQAYSAADVFVSLSREDVGPMTIVESLLCGTPVVAFRVGIAPEVIAHQSTGFVARCFSVDDIVTGIVSMIEMNVNSRELAQCCRERALDYGNPKTCAERHRALYEELLA